MFEKLIKGKAAVFIDAANIELSAKDLGFQVDYRKLHKWLSKECDLRYIGFFTVRFDNAKHDAFLTVLKKAGYKLTTKPLKLIKNSKDAIKKPVFYNGRLITTFRLQKYITKSDCRCQKNL